MVNLKYYKRDKYIKLSESFCDDNLLEHKSAGIFSVEGGRG